MIIAVGLILLASAGTVFPFSHLNVCKGYGDWNAYAHFHTGIDFQCGVMEVAQNPYGDVRADAYVLKSELDVDTGHWTVFLVTDLGAIEGWGYEHLIEDYSFQYALGHSYSDDVGRCGITIDVGRHLHMIWMHLLDWTLTPPGWEVPQPGYTNPFSPELLVPPTGYDLTIFDRIDVAEDITSGEITERGMWFSKDGIERPVDFPGCSLNNYDSLLAFQNRVWGRVDVVAKPLSAFEGVPENDSCGVRAISHEISWESAYSVGELQEIPAYGPRTLFSMTGELPDGIVNNPDEFEYVFFGGLDEAPFYEDHFKNNYILTNCGLETVSDNCLSNVWTDEYDPSEGYQEGKYCLGTWDTRLWNPALDDPPSNLEAYTNAQALFPDGRYAFEVTATSQGSLDEATAYLPTTDLSNPSDDNALGIVVDNFRPVVRAVRVYSTTPVFELRYSADWMDSGSEGSWVRTLDTDGFHYIPISTGSLPETNDLWIAIGYSEPMIGTQTEDLWLSGEVPGITPWLGYFRAQAPTEEIWPDDLLGALEDQEMLGGYFWRLYRFSGTLPQEYVGRLSLHIAHGSAIGDGLMDLAGWHIDGNPATVNPPRDVETGEWSETGYERDNDASYQWGTLHWYGPTTPAPLYNDAVGYYEGTEYAMVDFDDLIEQECFYWFFLGDCPYYCGFWFWPECPNLESAHEFYVRAYRPDGSFTQFIIPTTYDYWFPGSYPCSFRWATDNVSLIAESGNRLWLSWIDSVEEIYPPSQTLHKYRYTSTAWLACINVKTGEFDYYNSETSGTTQSQWDLCSVSLQYAIEGDGAHVMTTTWSGSEHSHQYYDVFPNLVASEGESLLLDSAVAVTDFEGIGVTTQPGLRLISNPVSGCICLAVTGEGESYSVTLYDLAGRLCDTVSGTASNGQILSIGNRLAPGVYFLRIRIGAVEETRSVAIID